jgi:hypothetical protein
MRALLLLLIPCWCFAQTPGEIPGLSVRIIAGQLEEVPTQTPGALIQRDLCPDWPFTTALAPASLAQFREFYSSVEPHLETTAVRLRRVHDRAEHEPAVRQELDAFLTSAAALASSALPDFPAPSGDWSALAPAVKQAIAATFAQLSTTRRTCALAFALSGQEAFARVAWEATRRIISHFYSTGILRSPYPWENPWDEAYELYEAAAAFELIGHWENLGPLDHALVYCYLRRLGERVAYAVELSPLNGSRQALWTCHLGCLMQFAPSMPEAPRFRSLVAERLHTVMADFAPDGGYIEGDADHELLALQSLLRYARVSAPDGGVEFLTRKWGDPGVSVVDGFDFLAKTATPLGETPGLDDAIRRPLAASDAFSEAIGLLRRGDWLLAARLNPEDLDPLHTLDAIVPVQTPAECSVLLPDSGLAVMRDGWQESDAYLLCDFGPAAGERSHRDKLSFILSAQGQPWVLDAGAAPNLPANADEDERWHRQTVAHNTVLADDTSQQPVDGRLVAWHSSPPYDLLAAEHDGYAGLPHRRTIFHPRGGYFLVLDELRNDAASERPLEWLLHVNGRRESGTAGRFVFWREGGFGLTVIFGKGMGVKGARISEGPCAGSDGDSACYLPPDGSATLKPGDPGWAMIPFIGLKQTLAPQSSGAYAVLLWPFRGKEPAVSYEVTQTPEAFLAEVRLGQMRDRILIRRRGAPAGMARGLGLATDGQYAFVREEGDKVTVMEYEGGSSLSLN